AVEKLFGKKVNPSQLQIQKTRKDFEGDYTLVVFPLTKLSGKSLEQTAKLIGDEILKRDVVLVNQYNVVKGFLNISINVQHWVSFLDVSKDNEQYGHHFDSGKKVMVEYSSPNTNKPLHLGHLRNNFLGYSISEILKACGHEVTKV